MESPEHTTIIPGKIDGRYPSRRVKPPDTAAAQGDLLDLDHRDRHLGEVINVLRQDIIQEKRMKIG